MNQTSKFVGDRSVSKPKARHLKPVLALLSLLAFQASTQAQGLLTPPGAPAPTMKSLDQIEPRFAITTIPTNLTVSGSYYLTGSLTSAPAMSGITIYSGNVTIDLNGFTLKGNGSGSFYDGIVIGGNYTNITIRNGAITGWGGIGLNGNAYGTPKNVLLERLMVSANGNGGISFNNAVVRDCVSINNSGNGFILQQGGLLEHCSSESNGNTGFYLGQGSVIDSCRSLGNPGNGIIAGINSRVVHCLVMGATNNGIGITLNAGSTAESCTVVSNVYGIIAGPASTVRDCVLRSNQICGIQADANARVLNNLVEGTGGIGATAGILLTSTNTVVDGCQVVNNSVPGISANNGSTVSGNLIIRNLLRGNTSAYNVSGTNSMGPIITTASGISAGIITNSNPWANFSY